MKKLIFLSSLIVFLLGSVFIYYLYSQNLLQNYKLGQEKCGIQNCHGTDITCGPDIPEMCTAIYKVGDGCRQFANCTVLEGGCRLANSPRFDECKSCVNECLKIHNKDTGQDNRSTNDLFVCEQKCLNLP